MTDADYDLMTPAEVAAVFRVDRNTCYAWRREGVGPASFKVGRSVRYRRSVVEAWLAEREDATRPGERAAS